MYKKEEYEKARSIIKETMKAEFKLIISVCKEQDAGAMLTKHRLELRSTLRTTNYDWVSPCIDWKKDG